MLNAGIPHVVRAAEVNEVPVPGEDPVTYVRRLARDKALAVTRAPGEVILAADTTVVCEGQILGKPRDQSDAVRMLGLLAGKRHQVITGVCFRHEQVVVLHDTTDVWFDPMTDEEIGEYAASGEPLDKAGAYAIQGLASRFVTRIEGSYSNVVGLPVALVWRELSRIRSSLF